MQIEKDVLFHLTEICSVLFSLFVLQVLGALKTWWPASEWMQTTTFSM